MSDLPDYHRRAVEYYDSLVSEIRDDQWGNSTPCTDWSVRDLVNHIVYENLWTPELLAGKTVEEVGNRFDGDVLGDDPKGAWQRASKEAVSAVQDDGAMERMVSVSWGQIKGQEYAEQLFLDHVVHGWDLAMGIGGDTTLDPELVEACWIGAKAGEELIRGSGVFGEPIEVPDEADTQTRLLALLGRKG
ncbi:MAG: hypothetical protein QOG54_2711 [Actinomycetota bacterium]|jgi:uncharacterized protein (TIGR03086 family)|nr:hypothetical protein [Actinomycetota bacterium]